MQCPECNEAKEWSPPDRPYCDDCDIKDRTCTKCGEVAEGYSVWIAMKDGMEVFRGHKECFDQTKL